MTIWRKRITCWITKAINTNSEHVILIAILQQQRLHERASMLRYSTLPVLFPVHIQRVKLDVHTETHVGLRIELRRFDFNQK